MRVNTLSGGFGGREPGYHLGYGGRYEGDFVYHKGYGYGYEKDMDHLHRTYDAFSTSKYAQQGQGIIGSLFRTAAKTAMSTGKSLAKGAIRTAKRTGKRILKEVLQGKTAKQYAKKHLGKVAKTAAKAVMAEADRALKARSTDSASRKVVKKQIAKHVMPAVKSFLTPPSKSGQSIKGHRRKKKVAYVGTRRRTAAHRLHGRSTIF